LLILLMLLMTRVATSLGVRRGLLNWVSSKGSVVVHFFAKTSWLCWFFCCCYFYLYFYFPTRYGDMPAHNLLWRECERSSDNVAARLAVIPLVQVTPSQAMPPIFYWCLN
jgi:hypothetical protein